MEKQEILSSIIRNYTAIYPAYELILRSLQDNNKIINRGTIKYLETLQYTVQDTVYTVSAIIVDKQLIISAIPADYRKLPNLLNITLAPKSRFGILVPLLKHWQQWCSQHIKDLQHDLSTADAVKDAIAKLDEQRRELRNSLCPETRDIWYIR